MARFSREAQAFARSIVENQLYRENLLARAVAGNLPPGVETMLYHYAYGKPPEVVEVEVAHSQVPLTDLSTDELAARARQLSEQILAQKEAAAIAAATATAVARGIDTSLMQTEVPELEPGILKFMPRTH